MLDPPTFNFDVDPHPDQDPTLSVTYDGNSEEKTLTLFTTVPVYLSCHRHSWKNIPVSMSQFSLVTIFVASVQ